MSTTFRRDAPEQSLLLRAADDADLAEDVRLGVDVRGDELPAALRRREDRAPRSGRRRRGWRRRNGRQPGQARNPQGGRPYPRAYGEPDEQAQSNFTDPESGIRIA